MPEDVGVASPGIAFALRGVMSRLTPLVQPPQATIRRQTSIFG
jgi:hypothetical protein